MERPEDIDALINSVDRYAPSNVAILEDYLCGSGGQHDLAASLAILKLYQFNPDLVPSIDDPDRPFTIFLILLKTLCHNPFEPDFNLAWALLGDQLSPVNSPPEVMAAYANLSLLAVLLQTRKLRKFWAEFEGLIESDAALQRAYDFIGAEFKHALRLNIAQQAVEPLFSTIPTFRFHAWTGLVTSSDDAEELSEELEGLGWTFDGDSVRPPATQSTSTEGRTSEDGEGAQQQSGIVSAVASTASIGLDSGLFLFCKDFLFSDLVLQNLAVFLNKL